MAHSVIRHDFDSVDVFVALLLGANHVDPDEPLTVFAAATLAEEVSVFKHNVIRDPHDFPGEVTTLDNEVRAVSVRLCVHKVLPLVILGHVLHQLGHAHLCLTRQIHAVDQPKLTVLLVTLQIGLGVFHFATVIRKLATVRHLLQDLQLQ